jgi:hypothetical protein
MLIAEITYLTWTADGMLRHAVYVGCEKTSPRPMSGGNSASSIGRKMPSALPQVRIDFDPLRPESTQSGHSASEKSPCILVWKFDWNWKRLRSKGPRKSRRDRLRLLGVGQDGVRFEQPLALNVSDNATYVFEQP